ncbi:MAG: hypothetical protein M3161_00800 [Actinomycetota bacterium]|nr:hypothetical protein [Actinomycetota bacterium]
MRIVRRGASAAVACLLIAGAAVTSNALASPLPPPPELWVMDGDGTGQRRVATDVPGYYSYGRGAWSPDSRRLVVDGIVIVDIATGEATQLTTGRYPAWSPTGDLIVFSDVTSTETTYDEKLYVINADGTGRRLLVDTARLDSSPSWSPDGTTVAFVSGPGSGAPGQVYVVRANGSGVTQISTAGSFYQAPEWSPDGTRLVFSTFDHRLYIVNADGTGERPLTDLAYSTDPAWCADGTLYFAGSMTGDDTVGIYRMSPSGVIERVADGTQPDCAPSGKLAFVRRGDIHVMDPTEQGTPNLTTSEGRSDYSPLWAPDGTKIAFISQPHLPPPTVVEQEVSVGLRGHLVVRGRLTPYVGCLEPLRVQRLRATGWTTLEKLDPDAEGNFRARVADRPGFYRVVAPHSHSGFGEYECLRAVSRIVRHRH